MNVETSIFGSFTRLSLSGFEGLLSRSSNTRLICKLRSNKASQKPPFCSNKYSSYFSEDRISWVTSERSIFILPTCSSNCSKRQLSRPGPEIKGLIFPLTKCRFTPCHLTTYTSDACGPWSALLPMPPLTLAEVVADIL